MTDSSGGVLPGVTVTASSPSMQGTRTDVTNEAGEYRFPAVPPGTYKLVYELAGFGTVNREGVNVGLGFTATMNIELAVATLQETVTVSGESPVVDVSTTTTASNFGEERLASLPNARDFWTVLAAAPAIVVTRIDVGGSAAGTQTGYAVYDTKEDQHRPMVEGIVNTEGTDAAGFYYDYGSIDEVAVQTKGHTAEMPWPGVWSNFVSKSGGNEFHGKIYADYQNKWVQRENIPDDLTFLCPGGRCGNLTPSDLNRMESYHDLNADVGGYVIKDKIWWYCSARDQNIKIQVPNFPVRPFETGLRNLTGKVTYALSQNNKLTGYAMGGRSASPIASTASSSAPRRPGTSAEESSWNQRYWAHTYKAGYESVLSDKSFLEVRGGQFKYVWPNTRYSEAPAYEDIANQPRERRQPRRLVQHPVAQPGRRVDHLLQGRLGRQPQLQGRRRVVPRDLHLHSRRRGVDGVFPGDVLHIMNNNAPAEVILFQTPSELGAGPAHDRPVPAGHVADEPRLTLNVGLRFDRYRSFLPEQEGPSGGRFAPATATPFAEVSDVRTFNHPVPRLGLIFDVTGEPYGDQGQLRDLLLEPGHRHLECHEPEQPGLLPAVQLDRRRQPPRGDSGRGNGLYNDGETIGNASVSLGGVGTTSLDPNLKNTHTNEISSWVEHELFPGFGLQAGYVYRKITIFAFG